jgi:hypothetical protein
VRSQGFRASASCQCLPLFGARWREEKRGVVCEKRRSGEGEKKKREREEASRARLWNRCL